MVFIRKGGHMKLKEAFDQIEKQHDSESFYLLVLVDGNSLEVSRNISQGDVASVLSVKSFNTIKKLSEMMGEWTQLKK